MKLQLIATAYEIRNAQGKVVAQAFRMPNGCFLFRDFRHNWTGESSRELQEDELIPIYNELRKKKNTERKKALKAAATPPDQSQGPPLGAG